MVAPHLRTWLRAGLVVLLLFGAVSALPALALLNWDPPPEEYTALHALALVGLAVAAVAAIALERERDGLGLLLLGGLCLLGAVIAPAPEAIILLLIGILVFVIGVHRRGEDSTGPLRPLGGPRVRGGHSGARGTPAR
jgi:hypothetical protein